jgi:hypothetical protein
LSRQDGGATSELGHYPRELKTEIRNWTAMGGVSEKPASRSGTNGLAGVLNGQFGADDAEGMKNCAPAETNERIFSASENQRTNSALQSMVISWESVNGRYQQTS